MTFLKRIHRWCLIDSPNRCFREAAIRNTGGSFPAICCWNSGAEERCLALCSVTPHFCCLKEKGSDFPLIFTASPIRRFLFLDMKMPVWLLPGPSRLPLVQPCFQTSSLSLPARGWPRSPRDFEVRGAGEEPWTAAAQEAIPSQFSDIHQNDVT